MSLDALKVATQGLFPLTAIAAAVQGLIEELQQEQTISGAARSHVRYKKQEPEYNEYVRKRNLEFERKLRIEKEDRLAAEFIAALVQSEIMYG